MKKCFNPTIIVAIVIGAYFAMIGDVLVSFEALQKPSMMQPFVKFDTGLNIALVGFNNFPITMANFSYEIGASARRARLGYGRHQQFLAVDGRIHSDWNGARIL